MRGEKRQQPSITKYLEYRDHVGNMAKILGWPPQEVDLAMLEFDRRMHG
jgi:hypothetical protein